MDIRDWLAGIAGDGPGRQTLLSEAEISQEPVKWLKYLLLSRAGVEQLQQILKQINRFPPGEWDAGRKWCEERLGLARAAGVEELIIGKVVPWNSGAQLRNYRMASPQEVAEAFAAIAVENPRRRWELWCCASPMDPQGLNLGGRLTSPGGTNPESIEVVWNASPRMVESVSRRDRKISYLRATREPTIPLFEIVEIQLNDCRGPSTEEEAIHDFRWLCRSLETRKVGMANLANILRAHGAREVCFCFKMTDGYLTIIDWDTEIESSGERSPGLTRGLA